MYGSVVAPSDAALHWGVNEPSQAAIVNLFRQFLRRF
jgi:hypothetical protein